MIVVYYNQAFLSKIYDEIVGLCRQLSKLREGKITVEEEITQLKSALQLEKSKKHKLALKELEIKYANNQLMLETTLTLLNKKHNLQFEVTDHLHKLRNKPQELFTEIELKAKLLIQTYNDTYPRNQTFTTRLVLFELERQLQNIRDEELDMSNRSAMTDTQKWQLKFLLLAGLFWKLYRFVQLEEDNSLLKTLQILLRTCHIEQLHPAYNETFRSDLPDEMALNIDCHRLFENFLQAYQVKYPENVAFDYVDEPADQQKLAAIEGYTLQANINRIKHFSQAQTLVKGIERCGNNGLEDKKFYNLVLQDVYKILALSDDEALSSKDVARERLKRFANMAPGKPWVQGSRFAGMSYFSMLVFGFLSSLEYGAYKGLNSTIDVSAVAKGLTIAGGALSMVAGVTCSFFGRRRGICATLTSLSVAPEPMAALESLEIVSLNEPLLP